MSKLRRLNMYCKAVEYLEEPIRSDVLYCFCIFFGSNHFHKYTELYSLKPSTATTYWFNEDQQRVNHEEVILMLIVNRWKRVELLIQAIKTITRSNVLLKYYFRIFYPKLYDRVFLIHR